MYDRSETAGAPLNRQQFDDAARAELRRAARYERPIALLRVELADWQMLAGRHGGTIADSTARGIAELLRGQLREHDLLGRLDARSFAILLPETSEASALSVAERIHAHAADCHFASGNACVTLAVHVGVACCIERGDDLDGILQDADTALADARRPGNASNACNGVGRVCAAEMG